VLTPKTIDNDLGLITLDQIVNYVTPGYATAVYVAVIGIDRIRTITTCRRTW
jgi:6-phosphofructokinase